MFTASYRDHRNPRTSSFTAMTMDGHTTLPSHTSSHNTSTNSSNKQTFGSTPTGANLRNTENGGMEENEIMDDDGEASPILPPTSSSPTTNGGSSAGVSTNGNSSNEKTIRSYGSTD